MADEVANPAAAVPIAPGRLATFAAGALPVGALVTTLGVYLTNYYASHIGIPLAAVGGAFMMVRRARESESTDHGLRHPHRFFCSRFG
jgi:hypothetical protein